MADPVDLLQIKIERAREQLPAETLNAIAAVDWKATIMSIRDKKGYNFEQLGDLELETELLLCGLISSDDYPKEIQRRMNISRAETEELVNEMNMSVFQKIKGELIKNAERKKAFEKKKEEVAIEKDDAVILKSTGIEIAEQKPVTTPKVPEVTNISTENREELLKKIENPNGAKIVEPMRGEAQTPVMSNMNSMLQQKILGSVQVPIKKTEHTLENIPNTNIPAVKAPEVAETSSSLKKDPYRLSPDE
jgi:hypothetical protein